MIEVRYSAGRPSPRAGARGALYRHRDADGTCNFLEIPDSLAGILLMAAGGLVGPGIDSTLPDRKRRLGAGPLFLAGMQVVFSGIFTSMVLLNRGEGQE